MHTHTQPSHVSLLSTTHEEVYVPLLPNPPPKHTCLCAGPCVSVRQTEREREMGLLRDLPTGEELLSVIRQLAAGRVSTPHWATPRLQVTGVLSGWRGGSTHTSLSATATWGSTRVCGTARVCLSVTNPHKMKVVGRLRLHLKRNQTPLQNCIWGLLWWSMNKNLPANAGNTGLVPDPGRSPMPRNS